MPPKKQATFEDALQALLDNNTPFSPRYLDKFSDLSPEQISALKKIWPDVKPERRISLLEDLEDLMDVETLVSFTGVARIALEDLNPKVRTSAIRLLWEESDPRLISVFIRMMNKDPDAGVRATAAASLGYFVYQGMMEELDDETTTRVVDALVVKMNGDDQPLVRRRALEAMGYAVRPDVNALIRNSYATRDREWMASALFAMGRSGSEIWNEMVLAELMNPDVDVQLEAVRAAGELAIADARRPLMNLLQNNEELDDEVRLAALVSLGSIGGEGVRELLMEALDEAEEDEEEAEIIESALDELNFIEETGGNLMFDFADQELQLDDEFLSPDDEDDSDNEDLGDTPRKRKRH